MRRLVPCAWLILAGCSTDTFADDGGGADGSADEASAPDVVSSEAAADVVSGGDSATPPPCPFDGGVTRPATCNGCSASCCVDGTANTGLCLASCTTGSSPWKCFSPDDCASGTPFCCLSPGPDKLLACPHVFSQSSTTTCSTDGACVRLCRSDSDCGKLRCATTVLGSTVTAGVCL